MIKPPQRFLLIYHTRLRSLIRRKIAWNEETVSASQRWLSDWSSLRSLPLITCVYHPSPFTSFTSSFTLITLHYYIWPLVWHPPRCSILIVLVINCLYGLWYSYACSCAIACVLFTYRSNMPPFQMSNTIHLAFILLLFFWACAPSDGRILEDEYDEEYVILFVMRIQGTARLVGIIIHTMPSNPRRNVRVTSKQRVRIRLGIAHCEHTSERWDGKYIRKASRHSTTSSSLHSFPHQGYRRNKG